MQILDVGLLQNHDLLQIIGPAINICLLGLETSSIVWGEEIEDPSEWNLRRQFLADYQQLEIF